jgi:hypothetical protein
MLYAMIVTHLFPQLFLTNFSVYVSVCLWFYFQMIFECPFAFDSTCYGKLVACEQYLYLYF